MKPDQMPLINSDGFYDAVVREKASRKAAKKDKFAVAPRFGAWQDDTDDGGAPGKRSASHKIMKNRGLTAHKKKIERNPRVKKREAFRKATIRRKGQVREQRAGGDAYGGEETGIRAGISRSRRMVTS